MQTRRDWLKTVASSSLLSLTSVPFGSTAFAQEIIGGVMPDEGDEHVRTWMAFGSNEEIWEDSVSHVQQDLAKIALAIARFEPVTMLVNQKDLPVAKRLMGNKISLLPQPFDDLWMRDTGAVFIKTAQGKKAAVNFNFNGWGNKQIHTNDKLVAPFIAKFAQAPLFQSKLILEGGGIEVDGAGTAIITESCVLNENRNPGVSKEACEKELKMLLGLKKIIWLPGVKGKDITDGHTDFYARFVAPGVVVAGYDSDPDSFDHEVTKEHLSILRDSSDANGRSLKVDVLQAPVDTRGSGDNFAAGYINFYLCNGGLIMPEFGDKKADAAARKTLQKHFPKRNIVALNIDAIAGGGGGIHCTTQQEPKI